MAYRTASQASTGQSPFFLLYGRDARLQTVLNFFVPAVNCPTIETEYAHELFRKLKKARQLARKSIQTAQGKQKKQYYLRAQNSNIHAGDLVMLKVEPMFKLDHGYKGPYRVNEVTTTNAAIQMMNDPTAEPLIVSLQRLSLCNGSFSHDSNPGGETTNLEGGAKSEDLKVGTVHQLRYKTTVLQRTVKDTQGRREAD